LIKNRWYISFALLLIIASIATYRAQIIIFNKAQDTFFYLLQDLAFLPIQVLLVTLFLNALLTKRTKAEMQQKLNMIIGVFFSEVGNELLNMLLKLSKEPEELRSILSFDTTWKRKDFENALKSIRSIKLTLEAEVDDLARLKEYLLEKQPHLLRLLENPNLLEHETFSDLLWATCHFTEELFLRSDFNELPEADIEHLSNDASRIYVLLLSEWLAYLAHLSESYPYMFSLLVRLNPFKEKRTPIISSE
jgi:hypothetical protein